MVRTKVFVGNLSFKTQESDLAKQFEEAGKVATANIISRGSRSLGYGFVEMESEEEARKAVELLNKKTIDGREINVEVARPREENAGKDAAPRQPRPPRQPRAPRPPRQAQGNEGEGGDVEGGARPRRNLGPRRPRVPRPRQQNAEGAPAGENKEGGARPPRRERVPRPPRSEAPRNPSATTLFVANLPFNVDTNGLSEIFAGLNIKSAHVVLKRNNRSKGFGFVEFNNADDQAKALAAVDKKVVDGRELIVKVALTEAAGGAGGQAPAAAGGAAPAPAAAASPAPAKPAAVNAPAKPAASPAAAKKEAAGSPAPVKKEGGAAGSPAPVKKEGGAAGSPAPVKKEGGGSPAPAKKEAAVNSPKAT